MKTDNLSIWQEMKAKGYSRREFMYFCGVAVAAAGLDRSGFSQVVDAFESKAASCCHLASLSGMHLLQRILHSIITPNRRRHNLRHSFARLHRDTASGCRPSS
jgi:hypothetical protein